MISLERGRASADGKVVAPILSGFSLVALLLVILGAPRAPRGARRTTRLRAPRAGAGGGLLVALTMKYADAILKARGRGALSFATRRACVF